MSLTEDGIENITQCPRTVDDIEHLMATGEWKQK